MEKGKFLVVKEIKLFSCWIVECKRKTFELMTLKVSPLLEQLFYFTNDQLFAKLANFYATIIEYCCNFSAQSFLLIDALQTRSAHCLSLIKNGQNFSYELSTN